MYQLAINRRDADEPDVYDFYTKAAAQRAYDQALRVQLVLALARHEPTSAAEARVTLTRHARSVPR